MRLSGWAMPWRTPRRRPIWLRCVKPWPGSVPSLRRCATAGLSAAFPKRKSSGSSGLRLRWSRSAVISTSSPTGSGKSPPPSDRSSPLRFHHNLADDLARFEHLVDPPRLGKLQAGVDQRTDPAGGEMVEQRCCRRLADVGPAVEAVDREEANRRADL